MKIPARLAIVAAAASTFAVGITPPAQAQPVPQLEGWERIALFPTRLKCEDKRVRWENGGYAAKCELWGAHPARWALYVYM